MRIFNFPTKIHSSEHTGRCLGPCSFEGGRGGVKNDRHNFLEARQAGERVNWLADHN